MKEPLKQEAAPARGRLSSSDAGRRRFEITYSWARKSGPRIEDRRTPDGLSAPL